MENGIYVKTITLNYLEYLEMMEKINKMKTKLTELYNKKDIAEVIIAKQRGGTTGTVDLLWMGSYTKFVNLETRYDD